MKITVFNGSPHCESGNTHIIVSAFLKGAVKAGAETENIFLAKYDIQPCRGDLGCWLKTPGKCIIKDDMAELLPKMRGNDVIVFATPLYVDNVTGIMKNFMDRCIVGGDPHFEKDENGECRHVSTEKNVPKFVVISNCGYPEQSHFQVLRLLFKRMARNFHSEVIGEIYRGGGELLGSRELIMKPLIFKYLKLVEKAGREVVENLAISEKTRAGLEKPLIPSNNYVDSYIENANKYFDSLVEKNRK
jgi:multimeric flavodoxin WrbA